MSAAIPGGARRTKKASVPYRRSLPPDEIEARLQHGSGSQWDPQVIEAFFRVKLKIHAIRQRGVGESLRQALDVALHSKGSTFIL